MFTWGFDRSNFSLAMVAPLSFGSVGCQNWVGLRTCWDRSHLRRRGFATRCRGPTDCALMISSWHAAIVHSLVRVELHGVRAHDPGSWTGGRRRSRSSPTGGTVAVDDLGLAPRWLTAAAAVAGRWALALTARVRVRQGVQDRPFAVGGDGRRLTSTGATR